MNQYERELQLLIEFLLTLSETDQLWRYSQAFLEHTHKNTQIHLKKDENGANQDAYLDLGHKKVYFNSTVEEALRSLEAK